VSTRIEVRRHQRTGPEKNQETMEHSSTAPLLLLSSNVCISIFLLCVPALYAGTRLMNEMSASRRAGTASEIYRCLFYSFLLYAGWLDFNVSYVGLVVCRQQRPLFDSAAVRNPASWLARVDAGNCLHMDNG
jgi:hypothetical protein